MKSIIQEVVTPVPPKFPALYKHEDGYVVLFTSEIEGTVVYSADDCYKVGFHSKQWIGASSKYFTKFTDEVVLSN